MQAKLFSGRDTVKSHITMTSLRIIYAPSVENFQQNIPTIPGVNREKRDEL